MKKKIAYISKHMAFLLRLSEFQMDSLYLVIQTKLMIQLTFTLYAVRKEHVRIPLQTGDSELDFLNELYTTALRDGVSPYSLQVEMVTLLSSW